MEEKGNERERERDRFFNFCARRCQKPSFSSFASFFSSVLTLYCLSFFFWIWETFGGSGGGGGGDGDGGGENVIFLRVTTFFLCEWSQGCHEFRVETFFFFSSLARASKIFFYCAPPPPLCRTSSPLPIEKSHTESSSDCKLKEKNE